MDIRELFNPIQSDLYVSNEYDTLQFLHLLFDIDFIGRLQFTKSSYSHARVDFHILNKENLKSVVVETKEWKKSKPTFISKNNIDNLLKHYNKAFVLLFHKNQYYWLFVDNIVWCNVEVIKIPCKNGDYDLCYDIQDLLSTNYDELEFKLRIELIT